MYILTFMSLVTHGQITNVSKGIIEKNIKFIQYFFGFSEKHFLSTNKVCRNFIDYIVFHAMIK